MIWTAVLTKCPENLVLPRWALTIKAILFPLQFFYWKMGRYTGYQWEADAWLIDGIMFSSAFFKAIANADGETLRIKRDGDSVALERVADEQHQRCERI